MAKGWLRTSEGLPPSLSPIKHAPFLVLDAEDKLGQGGHASASGFQQVGSLTKRQGRPWLWLCPALWPHTCTGRKLSLSASPTPAGLGSALPVKAGLPLSSFCVPYTAGNCSSIPFQPT